MTLNVPKNKLADNLKKLRIENNISQYKLAELLGFSRGLIANYEQGRREPDYNTLLIFSSFYDVSTDYLLGKTDEKKPVTVIEPNVINDINSLRAESLDDLKSYIELLKLRDFAAEKNIKF